MFSTHGCCADSPNTRAPTASKSQDSPRNPLGMAFTGAARFGPDSKHYSLHPFSKLLPPFPRCTGFPRLGVLRRLRPASTRSVDDGPSPTTHTGGVAAGKNRDGSRVHCRFARRRRSPTLSLRHRHG